MRRLSLFLVFLLSFILLSPLVSALSLEDVVSLSLDYISRILITLGITPSVRECIPCPSGTCPIVCGDTLTAESTNTWEYFTFTLLSPTDVTITMTPEANVDYELYVKWDGTCPSTSSWDCRPHNDRGAEEVCSYSNLPAGTYHVMIRHHGGRGNYDLSLSCLPTNVTTSTTTSTTTTSISTTTTAILDTTPPAYSLNSTGSTEVGEEIDFRLKWTDDVGLDSYIFSFDNCIGSFFNDTVVSFVDGKRRVPKKTAWSNVAKVISTTTGCTIRWKVYANDTSDNWSTSEEYSFDTTCSCGDICIFEAPYVINQNNVRYCIKRNLKTSENGISFSGSAIENTVLDCNGNSITGSGHNGIWFEPHSKNNTVKNCTIYGFNAGIRCNFDSTDNKFLYLNLSNNNRWGIFLLENNTRNQLINITANNINGDGINLARTSYNNTLINITGNFNRLRAIRLSGSSHNTIKNVIANNNGYDGVQLDTGSNFNYLTDITTNYNNKYGLLIWYGSNNNRIENLVSTGNLYYGVNMRFGNHQNNITDSSIFDNVLGGYELRNYVTYNYIRDSDFTYPRKIYMDSSSNFIYNDDTGNIWLKTRVSGTDTITRELASWTQSLMQWSDTGTVTAYYDISGLLPNTNYDLYSNSIKFDTKTTDSYGKLSFTVGLSGEHEIKVQVTPTGVPRIYVDPPSVTGLNPEDNFTIDINVEDVTNLYGFDFKLGYDTSILDTTQIEIGTWLSGGAECKFFSQIIPGDTCAIIKSVDAGGYVWVVVTLLQPAAPVNNSGTLATITFQVTGTGVSALDLYETVLVNSDAIGISHNVSDGYFSSTVELGLVDAFVQFFRNFFGRFLSVMS